MLQPSPPSQQDPKAKLASQTQWGDDGAPALAARLSTVGSDPWTPFPQRSKPNQLRFLNDVDLLAEEVVDGRAIGSKETRTLHQGVVDLASLKQPSAHVLAHPVEWSATRGQWYADLYFSEPMTGLFARLALCRFQPWGLQPAPKRAGVSDLQQAPPTTWPDLRRSAVFLTDLVWLNGTFDLGKVPTVGA